MDPSILEKAGLTNPEIKVYLALLESGSSGAGDLLKKLNLHRPALYDALERLMKKGLASYVIKSNRKYFEAANPNALLDGIAKKEEVLKDTKKQILELIPELESQRALAKEPQEVTVFKGNKGLKSILDDWLRSRQEILVIGAYTEQAESLKYHMKYTLPGFHNQRTRQKQAMKYIFPSQSILRARQLLNYSHTHVRILDAPFASLTSTQVYGDKVAIIVWSKDPVGIVIRSKEVAQSYRDYFGVLWRISKSLD